MLDEDTAEHIRALGGLVAITASHPHFYTGMAEWSEVLGDVPILLPEADAKYATRPGPNVRTWSGDVLEILPGVTLHRLGGHFEGSSVLEWKAGAEGRGAIFVGDTMQVAADPHWVSFMRSYPNMIPLSARTVRTIAERAAGLQFDRLYGGWWHRVIPENAKEIVARSADRYIAAVTE
jgi:hypothetical protein